jgi:hypothetical protein
MSNGFDVGFSGTQDGMTFEQIQRVDYTLEDKLMIMRAHHGDCIGGDEQFHKLSRLNGLLVIGHPPINSSKRAFCDFDEERVPEEYLVRNKLIVDESDSMIFAPKGEEELRSGTWSTVRYAKKNEVPGTIVWPDGMVISLDEYTCKF